MCLRAIGGLLLASTVEIATGADPGSKHIDYAQYSVRRQVEGQLLLDGYKLFGDRLRAAAILQACNREGIAKSIEPSPSEKIHFFVQQIVRIQSSSGQNSPFLEGLTPSEGVDLAGAVSDQLIVFQSGYREAIASVKDRVPEVCAAGLNAADGFLREKSAK